MANQMESCIGIGVPTSAGTNVPENLSCAGHGAGIDTGTGSIFFIGSPEQRNTESMENKIEWYIEHDVDTSIGGDMSENLEYVGGGTETDSDTDSIFFIASPE
jgi:hypothetical protein